MNRPAGWLSDRVRSYNPEVMPMKSWIALLVCLCVVLTTGATAIARSPVALTAAESSVHAPAADFAGRDEFTVSATAEQERTDASPAQPASDGQDAHSPAVSRFTAMSLAARWPDARQWPRPSPPLRVPARPPRIPV